MQQWHQQMQTCAISGFRRAETYTEISLCVKNPTRFGPNVWPSSGIQNKNLDTLTRNEKL